MKTKLKFLIKQSIKKKINTKWFKAANILIIILLVAIVNMDRIISFFGGDFQETTKIYVVDEVGTYDNFKANFEEINKSFEDHGNYELENTNKSIDELKNDINDTDNLIINIKNSSTNFIDASIISYNQLETMEEQIITSALNNVKTIEVLNKSGLSIEEIASLTNPVNLTKEVTNKELEGDTTNNDVISNVLIIVLIIPFFLLITMLTQMIGAEINDEKSTRGMEIIISNVSPRTHFISKIISSTIFVIGQALILIIDVIIALLIRKLLGASMFSGAVSGENIEYMSDILSSITGSRVVGLLIKSLPVIIVLFTSSFLLYAILAGVLASMTTNIEDYQQLQTPLMIILMVGYYIAIMASTFDGAIFVKIISYIPLLSFLVSPVIYLLGQISLLELIISTLICVIFTILAFVFGLRIYKVGILNYSSKDLWKKIFKSIKNSN